MPTDNNLLFDLASFRKIWKSDKIESEINQVKDFLLDSPLLNETLSLRNSSIAIIDLKRMTYLCCIGDTMNVCGWDQNLFLEGGVGTFLSKLRPVDFDGLQRMSAIMTKHVSLLTDETLKSFKSFFDFQMIGQDGNIYRVLQEGVSLKRDSD